MFSKHLVNIIKSYIPKKEIYLLLNHETKTTKLFNLDVVNGRINRDQLISLQRYLENMHKSSVNQTVCIYNLHWTK